MTMPPLLLLSIPARWPACFLSLALCGICFQQSVAQSMVRQAMDAPATDRVVVTGTALPAPSKTELSDDPLASPSSVTVRTGEDLKRETIQSYGDIFRSVAGVSVSNYDQGNLGYGLSLRGFDEGNHGGDIAYSIDGVPVNIPSDAVGTNGYATLAPLIPELVRDIAIYRGPFNMRFGDFALGGAVDIHTVDRAHSLLSVTGGSYDALRGLGVYGFNFGPLGGYTALEADTLSGYRDNAGEKTIESFTRLETPILNGKGTAGFRAQIYSTDYGAAGYLNRTLVENGSLSPTEAINHYDGGSLLELSFSTPVYIPSPQGDFFATLYVNRDSIKRWSDFNLTPDRSDINRLQIDDRWTAGGTIEKTLIFDEYGGAVRLPTEITVGVSSRSDLVSQDIYTAFRRTPVSRRADVDFTQQNAAAYLRLQMLPLPWLKVTGGTRYDRFFYDVGDNLNGISVSPDIGQFSPKAGLAVAPVRGLSIFGNYGEGVRSPDAVNDLLGNPDLRPTRQRSVEAGFSYDSPPPQSATSASAKRDAKDKDAKDGKDVSAGGAAATASADPGAFHFLADVYYTTLSNDVLTGPDGSTPENLGRSRRRGLELETSWLAYHSEAISLSLFANYSYVEAKLINGPEHQFVPGVASYHVNYGLDLDVPWLLQADSPHRFHFSASHQITGPKHLSPDGSTYTRTYTRFSTKISYANTRLPGFGAFFGLTAYPDRRLEEAAFDFGTDANGDALVGVSPKPLVNLQSGVAYQF